MATDKTGPKPIFLNNIVTPKGRLSFPHLAAPDTGKKFSDNKFKTSILFPKQGVDLGELRAKALECAKTAFGDRIKTLNDFQHPFRDGDQKDLDGYKGNIYITCKSKNRARVVDRNKVDIPAEEAYGGCQARLIVTACSYQSTENVKDPKTGQIVKQIVYGVTFLLDGVQKLGEGDKLGGGGGGSAAFPDDLPADDGATFSDGAPADAPTEADAEAMFR
jgi:hypothetical protein